jgi:hypothetical protein
MSGPSGAAVLALLLASGVLLRSAPEPGHEGIVATSVGATRLSATPIEPAVPDDDRFGLLLATWSEEELCRSWQLSLTRLQRARGATAVARIVQERRTLLDEIERRDAVGFAAWMSAGARAGSDPRPYLSFDG